MARTAPLTTSHWPATTDAELIDLSLGELLRQVAAEVPERTAIVSSGFKR